MGLKDYHFFIRLSNYGIGHKLIRPFTPHHNGKVERSHMLAHFNPDDPEKYILTSDRGYKSYDLIFQCVLP